MIDTQKIAQYDSADVYSSMKHLPDQILQVKQDIEKILFPQAYRDADLIAISGMGGSIYNYHIIKSLFSEELQKPIIGINGYNIPSYVSKSTLFIGSSYSGSTEETIKTTKNAIEKGFYTTALTMGGALGALMKSKSLPFYQFDPRYNPCGQPRVGVGYMIFGTILILDALQYLNIDHDKLMKAIVLLKKNDNLIQDKAYKLKETLKNTIIIFIASEHLSGVIHAVRNQVNETAKALAEYHIIPELNHHLMEGLTYPKDKKLLFVFYNSPFYYERNQKRFAVTKKVLAQQKVSYIDILFEADNTLEEFLLYLQFGSYLSFFLGIDYRVDPSKIPWVDYFKKELAK